MANITETWTCKRFEDSLRLGHVFMELAGNTADVIVTRQGAAVRVEWSANGKVWTRTERTVDAAARFAAAKVETARAWIAAQPARASAMPSDWC